MALSTSDAPTATTAPPSPSPSSSLDSLLATYLSSSPLLPELSTRANALLDHRVQKKTRRQVTQLQGELRDDFAGKAWAVKADWMARVVPEHAGGADEDEEAAAHGGADGEDAGDQAQRAGQIPASTSSSLPPTITSDTDGAAEMAKRVDGTVEQALAGQLGEAQERIEGSVRRSEAMELELWLGQEILDAFSTSAGDEAQAARFVLDRLEDACFEAGLP
ncbi:hypothetical protein JCM10449v2_003347 [Rhodotorula kratochvilovae]